MQKRIFVLSAFGLIATLGCSDDPAVTPGGAAGMVTAGGMSVTGTSGVGAAGVSAAGTGASAAGTGVGAAGTGAAGTGAAAGSGAAGSGAAGMGAAGMGAAGMAAAGASGAAAGAGASGTGGAAGGGATAGTGGAAGGGAGGAFTLTSSAAMNGQMLPAKYRCTNEMVGGPTGPNPPFAWTGAPAGTMSFALIMRDRTFNNYQHWTIYDIPASTTSLAEGVPTGAMPAMPAGARQANNSAGLTGPGYYGPCGGNNMYEFKLYALDVATLPMAGMTGASVEAVLEMHDLGTASLTVMSNRAM